MTTFKSKTEAHYYLSDLFDKITSRLTDLGVDLNHVTRKDISIVDEFHVRGAQVSKELAEAIDLRSARLIDIGCGIGGPCRMLADDYNCKVTGIDLSQEFIDTAIKLSELVGLSNKTKFICGDATELPFNNLSFDVAWTQHVQMNIRNKNKFYSEIYRILSPKGNFLYYDIYKKGIDPISYPVPWANESSICHLSNTSEIEIILNRIGFNKIKTNDETTNGISFFENLLQRIKENGPPKLGINLLMGETTKAKITNLLNGLKEEKLVLQSGIYQKSE